MRWTKTIVLISLLLFSLSLSAQEEEAKPKWMEVHGYIKDLQSVSFVNRADSLSSVNLLHNRLNVKFNISKKLTGRLELRNRIFYGDQIKQFADFGQLINQYNGLMNLSKLWMNEKTIVLHSVIDRMLLHYSTGNWDVKAGRQRINWGINTVWNPNDIFNAYNFLDFDYEERPGNDAVRIQHYFKNNSTLELACKPGDDQQEAITALLYKFNKKKYDFQLLGGLYLADLVVGGGWAGSIREAGFKGEFSYFHPRKNITDSSGTISFSLMADQTFKNDWYVSVAALYNSQSAFTTVGNGSILGSGLSAKQLFPYRYSFYSGVMKSFSPVTSLNLSIIYSPEKHSLILFPSFSWNAAKDLDLDFVAQSFFALETGGYRSQGTALFLRGKWSF